MPKKKKDENLEAVVETAEVYAEAKQIADELIEKESCSPKCRCQEKANATAGGEGYKDAVGDTFIRNEDGSINWRKMIKPEHIVLNRQHKDQLEKQTGKLFNEIDPESVDDKYKLILLSGIKEVAALRGFQSVDYDVITATPDYVAVKCSILWTPKNEDGRSNDVFGGIRFSALSDVKVNKSDLFCSTYTLAIAENRAFVRAVRSFLRIHITGFEEIDFNAKVEPNTNEKGISKTSPLGAILEKLKQNGKTFDEFKKWWSDKYNKDAAKWQEPTDIPSDEQWIILGEFKKLEQSKKS